MNIDTKPPESAIDYIAVGSLHILSLFVILDALTGWLQWFESYAGGIAWAIFAAIPVIVMAFTFGLISVWLAEIVYLKIIKGSDKEISQLVQIALLKNDLISQKYLETIRIRKILLGSSLGFINLALSFLFQFHRQPENLKIGFVLIIIGFVFIAIVCVAMAHFLYGYCFQIVQKTESSVKKTTKED
jgi:hypothetical protein